MIFFYLDDVDECGKRSRSLSIETEDRSLFQEVDLVTSQDLTFESHNQTEPDVTGKLALLTMCMKFMKFAKMKIL